jgi:hypothetical protein
MNFLNILKMEEIQRMMCTLADLQLQPLSAQVKNIICGNCKLIVQEFAEEVGISISSCHTILLEDLGMRQVSAKPMPRLLTNDLLQRANDNKYH